MTKFALCSPVTFSVLPLCRKMIRSDEQDKYLSVCYGSTLPGAGNSNKQEVIAPVTYPQTLRLNKISLQVYGDIGFSRDWFMSCVVIVPDGTTASNIDVPAADTCVDMYEPADQVIWWDVGMTLDPNASFGGGESIRIRQRNLDVVLDLNVGDSIYWVTETVLGGNNNYAVFTSDWSILN